MSENSDIMTEAAPEVNAKANVPALLPPNLAALAGLASKETHHRYAMQGVHLQLYGDNTYRAMATNGRFGAIVTGEHEYSGENYPPIDAVEAAPSGESKAVVPAAAWKAAFTAVRRRRRYGNPILSQVAVVVGKDVTTLASTDMDDRSVSQPRNLDGRFPPLPDVVPEGAPQATVRVDAQLLIDLLKAAAAFAGDDVARVEINLYAPTQPVVVRAQNQHQKFIGILMPLA